MYVRRKLRNSDRCESLKAGFHHAADILTYFFMTILVVKMNLNTTNTVGITV